MLTGHQYDTNVSNQSIHVAVRFKSKHMTLRELIDLMDTKNLRSGSVNGATKTVDKPG